MDAHRKYRRRQVGSHDEGRTWVPVTGIRRRAAPDFDLFVQVSVSPPFDGTKRYPNIPAGRPAGWHVRMPRLRRCDLYRLGKYGPQAYLNFF